MTDNDTKRLLLIIAKELMVIGGNKNLKVGDLWFIHDLEKRLEHKKDDIAYTLEDLEWLNG